MDVKVNGVEGEDKRNPILALANTGGERRNGIGKVEGSQLRWRGNQS